MTFNDTLKYDLATFSSIFPNRAAVLDQLFVVNGSGCHWNKDGNMTDDHDEGRLNELVAIEHFVGAGLHQKPLEDMEHLPKGLIRKFRSFDIPADIEARLTDTRHTHWYPMSRGYNSLLNLPANIPADWLNAAYECATLIVATDVNDPREIEHNMRTYMSHYVDDAKKKEKDEAKAEVIARENCEKRVRQQLQNVHDLAAEALVEMKAKFPDHKFEVNPPPTFDAKRKWTKGITPWPLDESPANFDLMIEPFMKAIQFAYSLRRKNRDKDIPYSGLPIGHDDRAGCLGPEVTFTAESLEYNETDQGRDALEEILISMMQICVEQGRRVAKKDLRESVNREFMYVESDKNHKKWNAEQHILSLTDPKIAAKMRILDRIDAEIEPIVNQDDPLEVEVAAEMNALRKKMMKELFESLKGEK